MGNTTKPFLAIPCYGAIDPNFFSAWLEFQRAAKESGFDYGHKFLFGDSLVSRARNGLTMDFLASDCTHMLFVDSDLVFSLDQVKRIISHDENIVGGFYPKKAQGPVEFVFNCIVPQPEMDSRRLTPVKYMGTGFLCVKRCVLEKMIMELGDQIIFKVDCHDTFGFDFWPVGVYQFKDGSRRYLSEDWFFCQRAIDMGYTVYGDNAICLKHSGAAVYPLLTQEKDLFVPKIDAQLTRDVSHYDLHMEFSPRTILDIGANVGAFSVRCQNLWPDAKITAVEPVQSNFEQLVRNCAAITALNVAAWVKDGTEDMRIGKTATTHSFFNLGEQGEGTMVVKCVDSATLPSCDLVKIDTEGCETEILRRLNLENTSAILCEYHSEDDRRELANIAEQRGFFGIGWSYYHEGIGLLKFARKENIKYNLTKTFNRESSMESADSAAAAHSPEMAAA